MAQSWNAQVGKVVALVMAERTRRKLQSEGKHVAHVAETANEKDSRVQRKQIQNND